MALPEHSSHYHLHRHTASHLYITSGHIELSVLLFCLAYQRHLHYYTDKDGKLGKPVTLYLIVCSVECRAELSQASWEESAGGLRPAAAENDMQWEHGGGPTNLCGAAVKTALMKDSSQLVVSRSEEGQTVSSHSSCQQDSLEMCMLLASTHTNTRFSSSLS